MEAQCNCSERAPTYPTYRETLHLPDCPLYQVEMLRRAGKVYPYKPAEEKRVCRVCGCTDYNACIVEGGEGEDIISTCYWIEADLCSACAEKESTV